ncbi:uncharacterized protein LOC101743618 [Bombyx mori]|uniref:Peptidase S1 domain-containing protein n=1 Tax=Bombyx mori TaxID=7091 RepID=A0A8R2R423_BOMMO|nr:uncharacterized protein LOC101743618 [Bombyx mori]
MRIVLLSYIFSLISTHCSMIEAFYVSTSVPGNVADILKGVNDTDVKLHLNESRRIIEGHEVRTEMPYMVYLKLPSNNPKYKDYRRWICGGVIIHEEYILTSAACIEDAKYFYVVSGTYKHDERDDRFNNPCIKNGAKKAIWKCIPRNYVFDGHENDNIRWMNNDIAIVKVDEEFDFTRRVRGCDFIPKPVAYNNYSTNLEEPGVRANIAGWGTTKHYDGSEGGKPTQNLLQSEVEIINKDRCKRRWGKRYYNIIDNYMICSKDNAPVLNEVCREKYVDCTDIDYSDEVDGTRRVISPEKLELHSAHHNVSGRRNVDSGGFCENDHGGPLTYGTGVNSVVIGIISACLVKQRSNTCYGPFLYTSVYKNRVLISCAIYKDSASGCQKLFRSSETHLEVNISWADHPDGPAKNEIANMRRKDDKEKLQNRAATIRGDVISTNITEDNIKPREGIIVRAFNVTKSPSTLNTTIEIKQS